MVQTASGKFGQLTDGEQHEQVEHDEGEAYIQEGQYMEGQEVTDGPI